MLWQLLLQVGFSFQLCLAEKRREEFRANVSCTGAHEDSPKDAFGGRHISDKVEVVYDTASRMPGEQQTELAVSCR